MNNSSATKKVKLPESAYRRIVREEILREHLRQELMSEGFLNEEIEQLLEFDWRSLGAAAKTVGSAVKGAAGKAVSGVKQVGKDVAKGVGDAADTASKAAGKMKKGIETAFQEKYKEALADDLRKIFSTIENKYLNQSVAKKANLDSNIIEQIKQSLQDARTSIIKQISGGITPPAPAKTNKKPTGWKSEEETGDTKFAAAAK